MQAPRTLKNGSHRRRHRATGRLRRYQRQWVRRASHSRASQWLRNTIPTTSQWFRHTLPATADQWRRGLLLAANQWLRHTLPTKTRQWWADLDRDQLRARAVVAALIVAVVVPVTLTGGASSSTRLEADLTAALERRAKAGDTPARGFARDDDSPPGSATDDPLADAEKLLSAPLADLITAAASPKPASSASPAAAKPAETKAAESKPAPKKKPERVAPIGGLDEAQMAHAATIVRVGQEMGLPRQAYVVALATALQESNLRNLANPVYPDSYQYRHDGSGYDHDSVGLFQQRPSMGWGTVAQIMDPEYSARAFYQRLKGVPGWENMPVTVAAQTVQVSAFPDYYAKHEPLARKLVDALT